MALGAPAWPRALLTFLSLALGPHPQRELTLMPRFGFPGLSSAWPRALTIPAMAKAEKIALWMRSRLASAGARGFIVGLSGGLDSALVARLAQMAAPG